MSDIEFTPIEPTIRTARAVQRLTLQDVRAGEFPHPEQLANPDNPRMVARQLQKLRAHPERYDGAFDGGVLQGYMKTAEWTLDDELPFANEVTRDRLHELRADGVHFDPARTLGIFGLVVSNRLERAAREETIHSFLDIAADKARALSLLSVKIVLHDHDPVQAVAREQGYEFTGRAGEAAGAPGLTQRLYRKPLDS